MSQEYSLTTEEVVQKVMEEYKKLTSMFIHELRNPLSLMKGTLQYIEIKHPEAKNYKYWDQLFELISEMEKMMSDASLLNSCATLNFSRVDLLGLIDGVVRNYKPQAENQQKRLSLTASEKSLPVITSYYCDPDKMKQVFSNLIKNALEATSPGDFIEIVIDIESSENVSMLSIQINDNGQQVPEDQIDKIFEPFVTYKKGGNGIGLALVKRIIGNHMGSITVTSSKELTSFKILLPISGK